MSATAGEGVAKLLLPLLAAASLGMSPPAPETYGQVLFERSSTAAKVPPVAFDHWRHRARHTCRVCHVDIGFAMAAGATKVSASTNRAGFHCGACHDGKVTHRGTPVFASCSEGKAITVPACRRCHAAVDDAILKRDYDAMAKEVGADALGFIDWEKAEQQGRIRPADFVEGSSLARPALRMDKEITVKAKGSWMSDVRFSHRKHAAWTGCEVCHPEIFPATEAGAVRYSMLNISSGEYCGVCHLRVAFNVAFCERCHVQPVR